MTATFHPVTSPPVDLGADAAGPFWVTRHGSMVQLEDPSGIVGGPWPCAPDAKLPVSILSGSRHVLYRGQSSELYASGAVVSHLGQHPWEQFAGADLGDGSVLWAFHIGETPGDPTDPGKGYTEWTGSAQFYQPIVPPGFWGAQTAVSSGREHVAMVCRRGGDIESHLVDVGQLRAGRLVEVVRPGKAPGRQSAGVNLFYGDPACCVSDAGVVSWAAVMWKRTRADGKDWSQELGDVFVDGHRVAVGAVAPVGEGETTPAKSQWIPALASTALGLACAWQSKMPDRKQPGEVTVALVRNGVTVPGSERVHPGFQPRLAAWGGRIYIGTSAGIWGNG